MVCQDASESQGERRCNFSCIRHALRHICSELSYQCYFPAYIGVSGDPGNSNTSMTKIIACEEPLPSSEIHNASQGEHFELVSI